MKTKLSSFILHSIPGLSFMGLIYVFTPEDLLIWDKLKQNPHELSNLFSYSLMFIIFYLNYYLFTPKLYFTKKHIPFLLVLSLSFGIIYIVSNQINWPYFLGSNTTEPSLPRHFLPLSPPPPPQYEHAPPHFDSMSPPSTKFDFGKSIIIYLLGILFTTLFRTRQYQLDLYKDKTDVELRFLKSQINPHFLFNSLNTIYALAIEEKAFKSSSAIIKLSGMMRHVIMEANHHWVSLDKEIEYISHYVTLQKMRFAETADIHFQVEGIQKQYRIAPLILIPFIENAFKYGINPENSSPIDIKIKLHESHLQLWVQNNLHANQTHLYEGTGLGISNTKNRLALLYPNQYTLIINKSEDTFTVELNLNLSSHDIN
jgi:hypothetical protein